MEFSFQGHCESDAKCSETTSCFETYSNSSTLMENLWQVRFGILGL